MNIFFLVFVFGFFGMFVIKVDNKMYFNICIGFVVVVVGGIGVSGGVF